ncbi:MAG: phosphatase PAP2 family protein [Coriobacteriales bacterium]|nr:phosphatase PAP2 family protein [Coriobacteriaceae bacterium]MDY5662159.1 phosphatase PAP2 family protein [Coriobacteriales bacterium]
MDLAILHWMQSTLANPFFDTIFPLITKLGEHGAIWLVIAVILICTKKNRVWGVTMIVAIGCAWLIGDQILKDIIARPRPFIEDPTLTLLIAPPDGYSLPSGHSSSSFCAATILSFAYLKKGWKAGAWVLAVLIAFSRVYLCVHNPSDVLAGAAFGVLIALIAVFFAKKFLAYWNAGKHQTV